MALPHTTTTTTTTNCQWYGHMARECPKKGKGKGRKGEERERERQRRIWRKRGYGKGGEMGGRGKEKGWKGTEMERVVVTAREAKNGGGKGWKGGGKGYGYQGTCFTCGQVGHKAAECGGIYEVQGGCEEDDAGSKDVGGVWVVAGVEEMRQKCGHDHGCRDGSGPPGLPIE